MSFQQWEIPLGETGRGPDVRTAVIDAIANAIARELVEVSDMPALAQTYSLHQCEVGEDVGLEVITDNLAICMGMPYRVQGDWRSVRTPPEDWPRVVVLPTERPWQSVHSVTFADEGVVATVYRLVRHVESTPLLSNWLAGSHAI